MRVVIAGGRTQLDWTIVRPGRLTNDAGTGRVALAESTGYGEVARDDVAAVLAALLTAPGTIGDTLELINPLLGRQGPATLE
jgi:uncharacterized protein YbjT (DUF2867 family)